jgi:hypothetical protein
MKVFLSLTSYPHNLPVFVDRESVFSVTALPATDQWQQRTRIVYADNQVEIVCEPAGEILRQVLQPIPFWQRITLGLFR